MATDPIFYQEKDEMLEGDKLIGDKWYFWNEVWAHPIGPYNTREEAEKAIEEYFKVL